MSDNLFDHEKAIGRLAEENAKLKIELHMLMTMLEDKGLFDSKEWEERVNIELEHGEYYSEDVRYVLGLSKSQMRRGY